MIKLTGKGSLGHKALHSFFTEIPTMWYTIPSTLEGKICLLPANDFDKLESYLGKQGKWDILK